VKRFRTRSIFLVLSLVAWFVIIPAIAFLAFHQSAWPITTRSVWAILLIFSAYVAVERMALRLSVGKLNLNFAATELPLLVGAAVLSPVVHIVVRFVAVGLATVWRLRNNPAISSTKAGCTNGSLVAAQVAAFSVVTTAFGWHNRFDVVGGLVLLLAWAACMTVDLLVPIIGRRLAGQTVTWDNTRSAVVNLINLSAPTMMLGMAVPAVGLGWRAFLLLIPVLLIARHIGPVVVQLADGDAYKALHRFFRLLQTTTVDDIDAALELAAQASKTSHAALVIVDREGLDQQLDSVLTMSNGNRATMTTNDLPDTWRGVLATGNMAVCEAGPETSIIHPLTVNGSTVGLLVCSEPLDAAKGATSEMIEIVQSMAASLSPWLEQDRLLVEMRREMETKTHQLFHDTLTGLLNRVGFTRAWEQHGKDQPAVVVMIIGLDSFKETNSFLGHNGGDMVLREAARRMQAVLPKRSHIARLGGDEFAVFIPNSRKGENDLADAGRLGATLRKSLELPFTVGDSTVTVAGTIGIAVSPHHGNDLAMLMRHADDALFSAKGESGVAVFADASYGHDTLGLDIDGWRLKSAIDNNDIECWFQPIIDMRTYKVAGFEALARWKDQGRVIMPQQFIALAEKTGHIHALTASIMSQAFANVARWSVHTGRKLDIGINISALSISNPELRDALVATLKRTGLEPSSVYLEVTEGRMFKDPLRATNHLNHLRETGVRVSLDDYGTGASTHEWLYRMAPDQIKIDRMFVKDMCTDERARGIVELDVSTGLKFNASVVAEGIESAEHWNIARGLGVQLAQGYLISRPKPASEIMEWLKNEEPRLESLIALAGSLDPSHQRHRF
jgi:diguanylate cyclase (GGDEF)-like protein